MIPYYRIREAIVQAGHRPAALAGAALTAEKLAEIRTSRRLAHLLGEIRAEADRAVREPLPPLPFDDFRLFREQGTRLEYERPYFRRRARLLSLTLALLIDGDDKYIEPLENTVWDLCGEYAWAVPAHLPYAGSGTDAELPPDTVVDLFAAETAHALAEMLLLVGDRLHPWIAQRVRSEIERRVFEPVFAAERPLFWFAADHNWSAVCAGAVGMAAMLLVEDRERLAWMQARVCDAMDSFLSGYGEDGCCMEGAGYWTYGFGYYVYWAEMLHAYTGGAVDLLQGGKVRQIAGYAGRVALTLPACVNYSDCSPTMQLHAGLIDRLRGRIGAETPYAEPLSLHDDHCYRWPHQVRTLLWAEEEPGRLPVPSAGTICFADAGWIIDKRRTPAGLFAFSTKGGHNDEPHNHNDLGHFIVHAAGETLLTDLGPGVYTQNYFGPNRYDDLHTSSLGHSVPVVNGCAQSGGRERRADIVCSEQAGDRLQVELDLTQAYGAEAGLNSLRRQFVWTCREGQTSATLEVQDEFEFAAAGGEVTEHLISLHRPQLDFGCVSWQGDAGRVELRYDPAVFEAALEVLDSQEHLGAPQTVYRTALQARSLARRFVGAWTLEVGSAVAADHED